MRSPSCSPQLGLSALQCLRSPQRQPNAAPLAPTPSSPGYLPFFLPLLSMQHDFSASFLRMEREINTEGREGSCVLLCSPFLPSLPTKPIVHAAPRHLSMLSCFIIYFQVKRSENEIKLEEQTYLALFSNTSTPTPAPQAATAVRKEIFHSFKQIQTCATNPIFRTPPSSPTPHISSQLRWESGRNGTG